MAREKGLQSARNLGVKLGAVVGAIGATAKRLWLRVTAPRSSGQEQIDAALSGKNAAELVAMRARLDSRWSKDAELAIAAKYSEVKQVLWKSFRG